MTWTEQVANQYCTHLCQVNTQLFLHRNFEKQRTKFLCLLFGTAVQRWNRLFVINRNPSGLVFCMTIKTTRQNQFLIAIQFMCYMVHETSSKIQCSKAREVNFQFWKLFAVVLDTHIKCVDKVHKRIGPTLVMLPLN